MFKIPTLKELLEKSRQSFRAYLKGSDAWLWPNNVYASAKVIAGMTFEVFGFASYISRQKFAVTAPDMESLLLHGEEFGVPLRPSAPAQGPVTFVSSAALTVHDAARLRRLDGIEYRVLNGGTIGGAGSLLVRVVAVTDGKATNAEDGTEFEILSGVDTIGDVTATAGPGHIATGADVEDIESYRARILFRKRNPSHGGNAADYVDWASRVSGVTRVFVERRWSGSGTVRVFPLMDDSYPNGIPPVGELERIAQFLDTVQPAAASVTVAAATSIPVNVTIVDLTPDTPTVREAVLEELRDTFRRLARPAGIDTQNGAMPYLATPTSFSRSWIWQAVANATGEQRHQISEPSADIDQSAGQMPTLGTVNFV